MDNAGYEKMRLEMAMKLLGTRGYIKAEDALKDADGVIQLEAQIQRQIKLNK